MNTHWLLLVPFAVIAAGVIYLAVTPVNGLPSGDDERKISVSWNSSDRLCHAQTARAARKTRVLRCSRGAASSNVAFSTVRAVRRSRLCSATLNGLSLRAVVKPVTGTFLRPAAV